MSPGMSAICKSIETLAMAYLDDELAAEERHELETHLTECTECRARIESERADMSFIKRSLAGAPVPSDMFRARLTRALDAEEASAAKEQRRRWYQYVLPGSAMVAAAAAMLLFVGMQATPDRVGAGVGVAQQATKHTHRTLPLEVQGASTGPWLQQHFASVDVPHFVDPGTQLLGARLLPGAINGHDAAALSYQMSKSGSPYILSVLVVRDLGDDEMRDGTPLRVNNRTVYVLESQDGQAVVSYVDRNRMGYMFMAPELSVNELVWLVSRTDLVGPQ
jgi:anti-sigma factor RsiW